MKFRKATISAIVILVGLVTIIGLSGLNYLIPNLGEVEPPAVDQYPDVQPPKVENMEKILLTTKDNLKIAANLYSVSNPSGSIVFSHMMPATKESWDDLAKGFQDLGYESIAIDLRGHGESTTRTDADIKLDYRNFSDKEQQQKILDVEAAVDYLKSRGVTSDKIVLIGASIGANLSLQYISEHSEFKKAVLLSVGENYFGINSVEFAKKLRSGQKIFLASAKDDDRVPDNTKQTETIYNAVAPGVRKEIKIYETGGHGTAILENQPELKNLIIEFVKS